MGTVKSVSIPTKTLAVNLAANATGAVLYVNNIKHWTGSDLVAGDFGTQAFAALRNAANTQLELIEIDPSTIASAAITILKRGLSYDGGQVDSAVTSYAWTANDCQVEFGTSTPQLLKQLLEQAGDETIQGVKTFESSPIVPTPTSSELTAAASVEYANDLAIQGVADSSTTVKGAVKLSTAPAVAANPIAVSATDPKVPTVDMSSVTSGVVAALAGKSGTALSVSNKVEDEADTSATSAINKLVRANGSGKIAEGFLQTTDANMTTLTGGVSSDASSLHRHFCPVHKAYDTVVANGSSVKDISSNSISFTIPGGALSTAYGLRVKFLAYQTWDNDGNGHTSGTSTLTVKLGTTTIFSNVGGPGSSSGIEKYAAEIVLLNNAAASAQVGYTKKFVNAGATTATNISASEDTSTDKVVTLTLRAQADGATYSQGAAATIYGATLELL